MGIFERICQFIDPRFRFFVFSFGPAFNSRKSPRRYLQRYASFSVRVVTIWVRFPTSLDIIQSIDFLKTLILLRRPCVVWQPFLHKNQILKIIRIHVKRFICLFKCGCSRPLYPPLQLFSQMIFVNLVLDFTLVEQRPIFDFSATSHEISFHLQEFLV